MNMTPFLAYPVNISQEADLPEICSELLKLVTDILERYQTYHDVYNNLPDFKLIKFS